MLQCFHLLVTSSPSPLPLNPLASSIQHECRWFPNPNLPWVRLVVSFERAAVHLRHPLRPVHGHLHSMDRLPSLAPAAGALHQMASLGSLAKFIGPAVVGSMGYWFW